MPALPSLIRGRSVAPARRLVPPPLKPLAPCSIGGLIRAPARRINAQQLNPSLARASSSFADANSDADEALARRRAVFLVRDGNANEHSRLLRIWRVGIDEPRLLKALEGAGFAGRVAVCPTASGCDAVLAVARKAQGGRQRVDLSAARNAAHNARAEFVLLRATSPRAVFDALAPMIARKGLRRMMSGGGGADEEDDENDDERVAAAVERLRRAAPALLPPEGGDRDDGNDDVGFTRVPTLRAVAAAANGTRPASSSSSSAASSASSANAAVKLLELLAWSEGAAARLPRTLRRRGAAAPVVAASSRPLLTPPRAARLPEPAWLWLGTAGAAADDDDDWGDRNDGNGDKDNNPDGRAAMVPRNRDARADAAFRVTRDDGGPLQPGGPGDAARRRQAADERSRRRRGGGGW